MTAKDLYLEALECSVSELSVFLDYACAGDKELRFEVEQLLEKGEEPAPSDGTEEQDDSAVA